LWPAYFNRAVQWRADRNAADRAGHIVGPHRLDEHWWQVNRVAVGEHVGDGFTNSKNCVARTIE
jgi:hypothetical protein